MVHFVGAGPGAVDLITVRGAALLAAAECVVYAGSLVNPALLDLAPQADVYDSQHMTLNEIVSVMARYKDKAVVRLHTGDPSIYGAIREQMDVLAALGIDYAVCPGVSSFCAAAASLKAEYTAPGVSQTVTITRAAGQTPVPEGETTILFLSAGLAEAAQARLLSRHAPDTPAAVVYKASRPDERVFRCTVGDVAQTLTANNITNHALICAGGCLGGSYEHSYLYGDRTR